MESGHRRVKPGNVLGKPPGEFRTLQTAASLPMNWTFWREPRLPMSGFPILLFNRAPTERCPPGSWSQRMRKNEKLSIDLVGPSCRSAWTRGAPRKLSGQGASLPLIQRTTAPFNSILSCRLHTQVIGLQTSSKTARGTVCTSAILLRQDPPVETVSRLERTCSGEQWFHRAATSSRLRWRTVSCRWAWSSAPVVFSSNNPGNTSKG